MFNVDNNSKYFSLDSLYFFEIIKSMKSPYQSRWRGNVFIAMCCRRRRQIIKGRHGIIFQTFTHQLFLCPLLMLANFFVWREYWLQLKALQKGFSLKAFLEPFFSGWRMKDNNLKIDFFSSRLESKLSQIVEKFEVISSGGSLTTSCGPWKANLIQFFWLQQIEFASDYMLDTATIYHLDINSSNLILEPKVMKKKKLGV